MVRALKRCDAALFLISPSWLTSRWCDREFFLAKAEGKRIFGVIGRRVNCQPIEMTSVWQVCDLVGDGSTEAIRFTYREATDEVAFRAKGLMELREGLRKAGLDADYFPWPPKDDRSVHPIGASNRLRQTMPRCSSAATWRSCAGSMPCAACATASTRSSSSSSAPRAPASRRSCAPGWCRAWHATIAHFFPLSPIRPEREPLFGERGLAHALHRAHGELKLPVDHSRRHQGASARRAAAAVKLASGTASSARVPACSLCRKTRRHPRSFCRWTRPRNCSTPMPGRRRAASCS